ncbi:MAG: phosphoglucosamine mutase [Candidatus Edwardsbacteria bacterium]|nr:phosphoglucosamine mutase [Candidatus Edwardsbacteria bacterium]
MISVAGVRGVVGTSFTPDIALRFAAAFGNWCGRGAIVLGRDSRLSGPVIEAAVEAGLRGAGCDVIRLGIVSTPTVQLLTKTLKAKGGIAITASHNPTQWNALKFVSSLGLFLSKEQGREVSSRFQSNDLRFADHAHLGSVRDYAGAIGDHVDHILKLSFLDGPSIRRRRFKVVLDTCHGAGGPIFALLLKKLGCEVISLHPEPDGRFSRPIEPLAKNLGELERAVKRNRADIGFATDADVDRLSIVSERGKAIGEEYSLALAAKFMFSRKRGTAVANLSTSRMIDDIARMYDSSVVRTPVGEANVAAAMKSHRAVIGGEGNGGIIIPELNFARDATAGIALILQLLVSEKRNISQICADIPAYAMVKETVTIADPPRLLALAKNHFSSADIDGRDGYKFTFPDAWLHVRASGTEPIVRLFAEARTRSEAVRLIEITKGLI